MERMYKVVLSPQSDDGYLVYSPDFDINTYGHGLNDALFMARDAIAETGLAYEDMGQEIPEPSHKEPILENGDIVGLVSVDFDEHRKMTDTKKVNTNVSIRAYIKRKAEKAKLNLSNTLEEAILAKVK